MTINLTMVIFYFILTNTTAAAYSGVEQNVVLIKLLNDWTCLTFSLLLLVSNELFRFRLVSVTKYNKSQNSLQEIKQYYSKCSKLTSVQKPRRCNS